MKSSNYCTLASLNSKTFYELCKSFPDIFVKMKEKAFKYSDPWKRFKIHLLHQIDYFDEQEMSPECFDEIQYNFKEEYMDAGNEFIAAGEQCTAITFVVQGEVELQVFDQMGDEYILETLR